MARPILAVDFTRDSQLVTRFQEIQCKLALISKPTVRSAAPYP